MKPKSQKTAAREVILLFLTILLSGLFYSGTLVRNVYFEKANSELAKKRLSIQIQIDSLPEDYIGNLYRNGLKDLLVVRYRVDKDIYAVPKKEEFYRTCPLSCPIKRPKPPLSLSL